MKILIAGYGSIGRVHAANAAAHAEIAVLDANGTTAERAAADGIDTVFSDLCQAVRWGADAAIIATPPDTHLPVATVFLEAGQPVLIEKPIAASWHEIEQFLPVVNRTAVSAWVVCNMRFHPAIAAMSGQLAGIGPSRFARADFGHYLPNMRPDADYRTLYAAREKAGGGVIRDAIHEIDYLMHWFGPVARVSCSAARLSDLDIDVEDYATLSLTHKNGVRSEIHLDYLRRRKKRGCEVCGANACLIWNSDGKSPENCEVLLLRGNEEFPETLLRDGDLDSGIMYRDMIAELVAAVGGKPHRLASVQEGAAALAVALAAREAAETGTTVIPMEIAA